MSFLNITDPLKRSRLVNDYLKTKRNIQLNNLSERLGDIEMKREFSKVFAPITESQQKTAEATQKAIDKVNASLSEMPKQLALESAEPSQRRFPTPEALIGPTAANYLKTYLGKKTGDTKYGIYTKGDKFYIGNKEVKIVDDDVVVDSKKYKGTPGLWELITSKDPKNYSQEDATNYSDILYSTDAMYVDYDPNKRPSASQGSKWKNIISPIYQKRPATIREIPTERSSKEPNKLVERYGLLLASKESGHTNVNNEMIQIANDLYKQNEITDEEYQSMLKQAEN